MRSSLVLLSITTLVASVSLSGCATSQDLRRTRGDLDQKIIVLEEKTKAQDKIIQDMKAVNDKSKESLSSFQKSQAEIGADITEIKDHIQQLRGMVEVLQKDSATTKELKEKVDSISFKVNFMENYLGIGKKGDAEDKSHKTGNSIKGTSRGKTDTEAIYEAAYASYKKGKYDKARTEFQNFLKQHPDSEYSGNAQFWIGECYYSEKKYEKAIIEYEKVVKNHSVSNKVSNALLKQGLAFQKLGDKASARLILQQVIKDYPNTNQARIARAKLSEIKK